MTNDFHSFINYANGEVPGISEHNIPGIVIPQKVYTTNGRPPQIIARFTFSVNHTVGLRLQDAVQTPNFVLDNAASIPVIPDGGQRASFRISWPGYETWSALNSLLLFGHAQDVPRRNLGDIAYQVAKLVFQFWREMQRCQGTNADWNLRDIPFHQLYLIELRNVSQGTWQPVIARRID